MEIPYSRTVIGNIPWYSTLIVVGILIAVCLAEREAKRLSLPKDTGIDLVLVAVPCGIVGARLYYVAMMWPLFAPNPISILYVWNGGLAIYGGVIGGCIGLWVYARWKKIAFADMVDILVPGLLLAQAIGRWGNYFNMEAYGPAITDAGLQWFPFAVLIPEGDGFAWHAATFFYESLWNLCGFAALWGLRKQRRRRGDVFAWYLLIYGSGRFIIEQLREDSLYIGPFRVSQLLSLVLCAAAAVWLLWPERDRLLGMLCAALSIARWACLREPIWYAGLMLASAALAVIVCRRSNRPVYRPLIVLAVDAAGWALGLRGDLWAHTALCSLTLPGIMGAMWLPEKEGD